ncbi:hypothetical protein PMI01_00615 [Caulobacter sp. AP07]|uniref:DUF7662 domain-containing protein n=1 Tax=Caulobacter sp. AP07 TaxID=1144304 RepID=UPI000271ED43|nr:hypothetical protein [Caulobacter sp. AP07]EJL37537.1 hypothetical protein PMI01_00615 [Caulobacter sp. AP07]
MAKYDPLTRYLKRRSSPIVELSFPEIERLIGAMLPKRARQQVWWSSTDDAQPQIAAWTAARYRARLIDGAERVRFERP